MSAATQIYFSGFDSTFFRLPKGIQERIEKRVDEVGRHLGEYQHHRLVGSDRFRVRVGDYRVIYKFNVERNEIFLLAVGHRREIYR